MITKIMIKKEKKVAFRVNRLVTLPSLFAGFNEFKVGDQIELNRGYTATCQKINKNECDGYKRMKGEKDESIRNM